MVALAFRSLLFESFVIPSGSMKPNLLVGDYLFVSKYSYGYSKYSFPFSLPIVGSGRVFYKQPHRGDVVVFRYPSNPKINYVKRLIGLPGDTIEVTGGVLYINGKPVKDKKLYTVHKDNTTYTVLKETLPNGKSFKIYKDYSVISPANNTPVYHIKKGHFFMMGDNRDYSRDSRFEDVGQVDKENLVGRASIIYFSLNGTFLQFWKWGTIRFKRIFSLIN